MRHRPVTRIALALMMWAVSAFQNAAFATFTIPSDSPIPLQTCFFSRNVQPDDADPKWRALLAQNSGMTGHECRDLENNLHYQVRYVAPNVAGVCRMFEEEVFPAQPDSLAIIAISYGWNRQGLTPVIRGKGWSQTVPPAWAKRHYRRYSGTLALVKAGACPGGDSEAYIPVHHVPDGMLKQFTGLWTRVSATHEALEQTVMGAPLAFHFGSPPYDDDASKRRIVVMLEQAPRIDDIACDLRDCIARLDRIYVHFDAGPDGVMITGVEEGVQP